MSGFTPGPWRINSRGNQVGPISDEEDQSFGMVMPVAYLEEFDWPDAHKANARLIAASPCMYALLERRAAQGDEEARDLIGRISNG